jgi:hypothetical protein
MSTIRQQANQNANEGPIGNRRRLDSWKEIAVYLRRDVRTVQRWERTERLPVYRLFHRKASSVYAYTKQIEAWLERRRPPAGKPAVAQESVHGMPRIVHPAAETPSTNSQPAQEGRIEEGQQESLPQNDVFAAGRLLDAVIEAKGLDGKLGKPIRMSLFVACQVPRRTSVSNELPQSLGWVCLLLPQGARVRCVAPGAEALLEKEGNHGLPN